MRRRSNSRNMAIATVVFTCTAELAEEIDLSVGPCVPLPGMRMPLVSVHDQHFGDDLEQMTDLYCVLTGGRSGDAWAAVRTQASGTLATFSREFRSALASLRSSDRDLLDELDEVAEKWLDAARWPDDQLVLGLSRNRLPAYVGWANASEERGTPLYCWSGPSVPEHVVVSGPPGTYPATDHTNGH